MTHSNSQNQKESTQTSSTNLKSKPNQSQLNNTTINNSQQNNHKWINQLRTLPSNPQSKDFLKLEYLEVNLNNSRKLINNLNNLKTETNEYKNQIEKIVDLNGNLIQLNQVRNELSWLD
ncbi:hypothetical protein KGF54_003017 [Candida jiufengensis]|uniref:uncharacterized protein n=1 Tax=Candida jiufengensis TaxID=497108 RepID=UPI0022251F97|nr:uncharacterized protein KGF54_003017 [Candida jiufengensis]KAI5953645.1 hypothetical protein KGF54_003017 [Candida jiufengensis]